MASIIPRFNTTIGMWLRCCTTKNLMQRRFISLSSAKMQQERPVGQITMAYNSYEATTAPESDANPVVIMHGIFGSKQNWRSICKALHSKSIPCRKVIDIQFFVLIFIATIPKVSRYYSLQLDRSSGRSQPRWEWPFSKPFVWRFGRRYCRIL